MRTDWQIMFWAQLVIANVWGAANHPWVATIWILMAVITRFLQFKLEDKR